MNQMGGVCHLLGNKQRHAECMVAAQMDHRCAAGLGGRGGALARGGRGRGLGNQQRHAERLLLARDCGLAVSPAACPRAALSSACCAQEPPRGAREARNPLAPPPPPPSPAPRQAHGQGAAGSGNGLQVRCATPLSHRRAHPRTAYRAVPHCRPLPSLARSCSRATSPPPCTPPSLHPPPCIPPPHRSLWGRSAMGLQQMGAAAAVLSRGREVAREAKVGFLFRVQGSG
jgi:hypothetical protein